MTPAEDLVSVLDMGLYGRHLAIGSRLVGNVLQWYDGSELHLLRGRLLESGARRRCFEFQRAADGLVVKFAALGVAEFEKRFRADFPDAPREATAAELTAWLRSRHGLWK